MNCLIEYTVFERSEDEEKEFCNTNTSLIYQQPWFKGCWINDFAGPAEVT